MKKIARVSGLKDPKQRVFVVDDDTHRPTVRPVALQYQRRTFDLLQNAGKVQTFQHLPTISQGNISSDFPRWTRTPHR